ncbi:MAG TPA: serine/threonine-protein kinase, partial [Planctomycetota bacterium]|nr:serine/threonine-protein kinase [Planctomycetota bacterium]
MTAHDWKSVRAILERTIDLAGEERERVLAEACAGDAELRAEVELLLAQESGPALLEPPDAGLVLDLLRGDEGDRRRRIGPYELERVIGSGGMGSVWLARRVGGGFEQRVAIKLIRRGMDTEDMLRRFARERAVLAGLEHPNIARLYDGGATDDGRPFLVMEFVEGLPLDEHVRASVPSLRERVELFLSICSAVGHAHQRLVVHRDLKPSNVLVSKDGTPKLLDFGIAKLLTPSGAESEERTLTAQRILTPLYASPEQLRGERVTTQSDVYSLGVLLYELLCTARPFDETRKPDTEPLAPSRVTGADRRALAGDLDTIVLKAMQPELARRYATVEQLAADLDRHLAGLPVIARPDTWRYRAAKFVRRNKVFVAAASITIVSLVAGLATSTKMYLDAREQRVLADQRLDSVLKISASFTRDLGGRLAHLPGATAAREQVLRQALQQLEAIALEVPENASVQVELCWGYHDLAATLGNPSDSSLGRYGEALELLEKPVAIAERLLARNELDREFALAAASTFR